MSKILNQTTRHLLVMYTKHTSFKSLQGKKVLEYQYSSYVDRTFLTIGVYLESLRYTNSQHAIWGFLLAKCSENNIFEVCLQKLINTTS